MTVTVLAFLLLPNEGEKRFAPPKDQTYFVRQILVDPHDIFDPEERTTFLHDALNALHVRTRRYVLAREVLLEPGQAYDPALAEETERNLRALGFVVQAEVVPVFHSDGTVDLYVFTRDRFTLRVGAGGGFFGGESRLTFSLGESNFLGRGLELSTSVELRGDNNIFRASFADPRLLGTRYRLGADLSLSDFGHRVRAAFALPYWALDTRWSWGLSGLRAETAEDFYFNAVEVNRIPYTVSQGEVFVSHAWGDRELRFKLRPSLFFQRKNFSFPDPEDVVPGFEIALPPDRTRSGLYLAPRIEWTERFVEGKRLDAIDVVEDYALGLTAEVSIGAEYWDSPGAHGPRFPISLDLLAAFHPFEDHLVTLGVDAALRLAKGGREAWGISAFFHHYYQGLPWQTIAWSVAFDAGEDEQDLPIQFTLGEESGLRGYEARRFAGDRRLRINVEDRIDTPIEFFTFRLGLVVFFDAGYAWSAGSGFDLGDLRTSVGFGLRIGSPRFLKTTVLRLDLAFPLHDDGDAAVTFSLTTGQMFQLFRNPSNLEGKF